MDILKSENILQLLYIIVIQNMFVLYVYEFEDDFHMYTRFIILISNNSRYTKDSGFCVCDNAVELKQTLTHTNKVCRGVATTKQNTLLARSEFPCVSISYLNISANIVRHFAALLALSRLKHNLSMPRFAVTLLCV